MTEVCACGRGEAGLTRATIGNGVARRRGVYRRSRTNRCRTLRVFHHRTSCTVLATRATPRVVRRRAKRPGQARAHVLEIPSYVPYHSSSGALSHVLGFVIELDEIFGKTPFPAHVAGFPQPSHAELARGFEQFVSARSSRREHRHDQRLVDKRFATRSKVSAASIGGSAATPQAPSMVKVSVKIASRRSNACSFR